MGVIVLSPEATAAWEALAVRRAELEERIACLVAEADGLEEGMFRAVLEAQGLDPSKGWEMIEEHYEDFGVVLVREMDASPDEDDEDFDPEEMFDGQR